VPTDTVQVYHPLHARNFALRGMAWSLAFFGLVRLAWFESHAVLPFTQWQGRVATVGFGAPPLPVDVTLACSGADAIALCAGAILAYPVGWGRRLAGAAGGIALILGLNTVRIGTLGRAAGSPSWFDALHLYIWPAILVIAVAGYAFAWMRSADTPRAAVPSRPSARSFLWVAAALLLIFTAAAPWYLHSPGVAVAAALIAQAAAALLDLVGVRATATGNMLMTTGGAFAVTQECVSTPLIPLYLAAVATQVREWRWRLLALAAAVPLFLGLGMARLLVVAVPAALVGSPLVVVHAFYQLVLAAVLVYMAAAWRHGHGTTARRRASVGAMSGAICAYLVGLMSATTVFAAGTPLEDPQGALALLPAFQFGLYVALAVAAFAPLTWRPFVIGLTLLAASQVAAFAALHALVQYVNFTPHVRDIRAWAIAGPVLAAIAVVTYARPRR